MDGEQLPMALFDAMDEDVPLDPTTFVGQSDVTAEEERYSAIPWSCSDQQRKQTLCQESALFARTEVEQRRSAGTLLGRARAMAALKTHISDYLQVNPDDFPGITVKDILCKPPSQEAMVHTNRLFWLTSVIGIAKKPLRYPTPSQIEDFDNAEDDLAQLLADGLNIEEDDIEDDAEDAELLNSEGEQSEQHRSKDNIKRLLSTVSSVSEENTDLIISKKGVLTVRRSDWQRKGQE